MCCLYLHSQVLFVYYLAMISPINRIVYDKDYNTNMLCKNLLCSINYKMMDALLASLLPFHLQCPCSKESITALKKGAK